MLEKNTRWAVIGAGLLFVISGLHGTLITHREAPRSFSYAGSIVSTR